MNFKNALIISRPMAWTWTVGLYLVGMGGFINLTWLTILELLFMTLPINFVIYGINDIYDQKTDIINASRTSSRRKVLRKLEIKHIKIIALIFSIGFIAISALSKSLEHILLSALFILVAYAYSMPPVRFKEMPFLDTVFGGASYLFSAIIAFTSHSSLSTIPLVTILYALPLMAAHAIFAIKDIAYDLKAKVKTTASYLGKNKTFLFVIILYIIPLIFINNLIIRFMLILSILFVLITLFKKSNKEKRLPDLVKAAYIMLNLGLIYFIIKLYLG